MKFLLLKYICLIVFFLMGEPTPQSNLEIISSFNDSILTKIMDNLPQNSKYKLFLTDNFSSNYIYFHNKLLSKTLPFIVNKAPLATSKDTLTLNYSIEKIEVHYGEVFRNGILGDFYSERLISFNANYFIKEDLIIDETFKFNYSDTVKVADIKKIESDPFIFTKGEPPKEYLFPTLLEPIVALGVSAAAIILFFTIRSK